MQSYVIIIGTLVVVSAGLLLRNLDLRRKVEAQRDALGVLKGFVEDQFGRSQTLEDLASEGNLPQDVLDCMPYWQDA